MAKQIKSKRVVFKKGRQTAFILKAKNRLDLTWRELSVLLGMSVRNLADWRSEKISMTIDAVNMLCKKLAVGLPKSIEVRHPYWYVHKGAKKGGLAVFKKYGRVGGDPEVRISRWRAWWDEKGKFMDHAISKARPVKKPKFSSKLAEFTGVMLGDGGMTRYQLKITLNCDTDSAYAHFLENLIEELFDIKPIKRIRRNCRALDLEISRSNLVKFCSEKLGLKIGNKVRQQADIPRWILGKDFLKIACLRGLFDTDGTVIIHKYKSKGKWYIYKKIGFTSRSGPLLKLVSVILREFGIKHESAGRYDVRIGAKGDVKKYFRIIGSHNPKHIEKYFR